MRKSSRWLWPLVTIILFFHFCQPALAQMAPDDADVNSLFGVPAVAEAVATTPVDKDTTLDPGPNQVPFSQTAKSDASSELEFDNTTIEKLNEEIQKSASSSSSSGSSISLGLLEIEEQIALDNFEKAKDLVTRAVLLQVYEKMAFALCFPSLNSILSKADFSADKNCENILTKIENIHANNTILICAKKGLESVECSQSFEQQRVEKASDSDKKDFSIINSSFEPSQDPLVKQRFAALQNQLIQANENYSSQSSIANLRILETASFAILSMICRNQMLALSKESSVKEPTPSSETFASIVNSLENLESSIEPTATPATEVQVVAEETNFFRTRLLDESCYDTVSDLYDVDSRLPSATCFKDSFLAPSCISALRRFRTLKDDIAENLVPPTPKDSLSSF